MQEEEPEEQTTPRPDRTESPLGEGAEEFLAAELSEVIQRAGDYPEVEAGVTPLPIPDVPEPVNVDDISFQPRPLPDVPEPIEAGMDPDPVLMVGMNPDPETMGGPESIESAGEWTGPEVAPSVEFQVDEVSSLPFPLPTPGLEDGLGEVGSLPIPTSHEANLVEDNVAAGLDEELFEEPLE